MDGPKPGALDPPCSLTFRARYPDVDPQPHCQADLSGVHRTDTELSGEELPKNMEHTMSCFDRRRVPAAEIPTQTSRHLESSDFPLRASGWCAPRGVAWRERSERFSRSVWCC